MRFFFYGTLLDADVRALVLGPGAPEILAPARLVGWRRVFLRGRHYPVVVPAPGGDVAGLLARGLDRAAARRLAQFEGTEYRAVTLAVTAKSGRTVAARVFVAAPGAVASPRAWDFAAWQRRHKAAFCRRLRARPGAA